ncbi:MAG: hypothetical protein ABIQ39_02640, partial [Ilumatobacteraceae bacterium]
SYAPSGKEDREFFPSISAAKEALCSRRESGHWMPQAFHKVIDGDIGTITETALTPCVDDSSYLDLYAGPDTDDIIDRIEFGPRGGVRRCIG